MVSLATRNASPGQPYVRTIANGGKTHRRLNQYNHNDAQQSPVRLPGEWDMASAVRLQNDTTISPAIGNDSQLRACVQIPCPFHAPKLR